jgi:enoyl-CoA hydratase/carnithine racemase
MADLLVDTDVDVRILTLNRPHRLNAWTEALRDELRLALLEAERDAAIGAVVLTGAGDRAFCSGQDVDEMRSLTADSAVKWMEGWEVFFDTIRSTTKPLLAALNGLAVGSAFQAALMCDLRVGHSGVRMGQPEINNGVASIVGPWIMREVLGHSRTVELVLTGRLMDGAECERLGLIHRLVPSEQVLATAVALAQSLAEKPPAAMRRNKSWLRELTEPGFRQACAKAIHVQAEVFGSGEPGRQMAKFVSRREKTPS